MEENFCFGTASAESECAICWEIMPESEAASLCLSNLIKVCEHKFHETCAQKISMPWKCPLCRARFYRISFFPRKEWRDTCRCRSHTCCHTNTAISRLGVQQTSLVSTNYSHHYPSMTVYRTQSMREESSMTRASNLSMEERSSERFLNPSTIQFSVGELQSSFPAGVDPTRKEEYLTNTDFCELFGMEKESFRALPNWKRVLIKKQHKLF